MKDAFGGAFMLRIMIVFFVVFISFMTVAIRFAQTFRVKNNVINIIQHSNSSVNELRDSIENFLVASKYIYSSSELRKINTDCSSKLNLSSLKNEASLLKGSVNGVCLVPIGSKDTYYYRVTSYIVINVPLFNLNLMLPITGESRIITS